jgi:hypothetical protein
MNDIACNLNWIEILKFNSNTLNLNFVERNPNSIDFIFKWIYIQWNWIEIELNKNWMQIGVIHDYGVKKQFWKYTNPKKTFPFWESTKNKF